MDEEPTPHIAHVLLTFTLAMEDVLRQEDMEFLRDPTLVSDPYDSS